MKKFYLYPISVILMINLNAETPNFKKCYDTASPIGLRECASKEYDYYDKQLNIYYKKLMKLLPSKKDGYPEDEKNNLKKAQRAWLKYRDLNCHFEAYPMRGGTGEWTLNGSCHVYMIKERVKELKTNYEFAKEDYK